MLRRASLWAALLAFATFSGSSFTLEGPNDEPFRLRILHTNDMHARFEQVSQSAGKCSEYEEKNNLCYGGFARIQAALVDEILKAEKENVSVLSLNAGDTYQGTVWYSMFKWKVVLHFLKMLKIDAMALGNHEFDDGIAGLVPLLKDINVPVLAANIEFSGEPDMASGPIKNHLVIEKNGIKIGIIGYLTPETMILADTGKLRFTDEIEVLKKESKALKATGVNIIIALGHSGLELDIKIAKEVPDVDVVVGGHSHSFLYTGTPPDSDVPVNKYPVMVSQASGRKVAIVQAYAFTKYLGKVDLIFDRLGELVNATGNPILLNSKIREDSGVAEQVKEWKGKLDVSLKQTIGTSKVIFNGFHCRFFECNLGNLITDAYIHHVVKNHNGEFWTEAGIAIQQAGGIRASLNTTASNGTITKEDMIMVMPFFSTLSLVQVKGRYLMEALEWSVARYDIAHNSGRGEFLQVSGIKATYNVLNPPGQRIRHLSLRCTHCSVPRYEPFRPDKDYYVIMPTFIFKGGDNFSMFKEHGKELKRFDTSDTDIVIKYVEEKKLVYHGLEDRIIINEITSSSYRITPSSTLYIFFSVFLFPYLLK